VGRGGAVKRCAWAYMEPLPPLSWKGLASVTKWPRSQNEKGKKGIVGNKMPSVTESGWKGLLVFAIYDVYRK